MRKCGTNIKGRKLIEIKKEFANKPNPCCPECRSGIQIVRRVTTIKGWIEYARCPKCKLVMKFRNRELVDSLYPNEWGNLVDLTEKNIGR